MGNEQRTMAEDPAFHAKEGDNVIVVEGVK